MKKLRPIALILFLLMLASCGGKPGTLPPDATTANSPATTEGTASELQTTLPQTAAAPRLTVENTTIVRSLGVQKTVILYRTALTERYGSHPSALIIDNYTGGPAVIITIDESYPEWYYTISCDGETARISGRSSAELNYAVMRFLDEFVDGEGYLISGEAANTMLCLRDPCILPYDGKYYIIGTGYTMRVSDDLYTWSEPWRFISFEDLQNPAYDGVADYWAPELYEYGGMFYVFGTYRSGTTGHRGVAVFRSDVPEGPYELISEGHITPADWDSIDGSLYVDGNGDPWMVFVHEWTSTADGVGTMVASRMTPDLTALTGEITTLFSASELVGTPGNNVTDGPYVYEFESGRLALIWSGFSDGYCVGVAYSDGGILGPWVQSETALYRYDEDHPTVYQEGGHGMLFETFDGRLLMSFHSPNSGYEAVTYREIIAENDELRLK